MIRLFLFAFLFWIGTTGSYGQDKIEREYRIKKKQVPERAITWLSHVFPPLKKVKWYREESTQGQSVEAKFKYQKVWYSVEFNEQGTLEDVERILTWEELPAEVQDRLLTYFNSSYRNFSLKKIQEQWLGDGEGIRLAIDEQDTRKVTVRYELEFQANGEEGNHLWEGLFDDGGNLISKRKIVIRPIDNLSY